MLNNHRPNTILRADQSVGARMTDARLRRTVRELIDSLIAANVDLETVSLEDMKRMLVERVRNPDVDLRQLRLWVVDSIVESHVDLHKISLEEMKRVLATLARQMAPGLGGRGTASPRLASATLLALFCCFAPEK